MSAALVSQTSPLSYGADWRYWAACQSVDPEVMFPMGEDDTAESDWAPLTALRVREAKAVCAGCPVRADCLAWALETGQVAGVWGGLSTPERRALRRSREGSDAADPGG